MPDILTLQCFTADDGAVVRIWTVADDQRAEVERVLGEPAVQQIYTAEQLETAHRAIGPVPSVYRHGA